jgi:hypothetical protein
LIDRFFKKAALRSEAERRGVAATFTFLGFVPIGRS